MSTAPGPAPFRTSVPYDALDLSPFRELPAETWSRELLVSYDLVDAVVTARCLSILEALDPGLAPGRPIEKDAARIAAAARVAPGRRYALEWMLRKLAWSGLLDGDAGGTVRAIRPGPWEAATLEAAIRDERSALGSTFDLIEEAARGYPAFLRGETDGAAILFGRGAMPLWERYFSNANRAYAPVNLLGAHAADLATRGRRVRVLEVGGGCGSGAEALLARIGGRVASYLFTEVSPSFLRRGRDALREQFPERAVACRRADLDAPLAPQGVGGGAFDLVYAVNTLHVVRDLVASLRELRLALAPGGVLMLVEAVRPHRDYPVPIELVFQLLPQFQAFAREPGVRERGGFLYWEDWRVALERAGFARVRFVPDMAAAIRSDPNYSMAAIAGEP